MNGDGATQDTACTRRRALQVLSAWGAGPLLASALHHGEQVLATSAAATSYRLEFAHSLNELIGDLETTERGDPLREADVPHLHWYSEETRRQFHGWGPLPRNYAPLANCRQATMAWKRERAIAVAARFLGYGYQHHHIPDWNPPADWPWLETCVGHNGKGVDCSNLTSFVYNQGFGIRMSSAIRRQAETAHALKEHHDGISLRTVDLPRDYGQRQETLRTGDLVYIRGRKDGPITHVVLWVGSVGRATSGVPLVIDSHGSGVVDDDGRAIACGVQIRPFREHSWYNRCASHAHRLFHDQAD